MAIKFLPRDLECMALGFMTPGADSLNAAEHLQDALKRAWGWDVTLAFARDVIEFLEGR
ncbi:hypothetical protein [Cupriavidus taiwanensis]|uniref:hypothetical protein n=1 Tax=Cupriavidus taiwanensis TaxID=164546 RepID=UPI000E1014A0|nr:hypothetical protein [Cupriavidus taiwanensis]SPA50631.1 protein of unknown function [Cupriavidus taiwanensis]